MENSLPAERARLGWSQQRLADELGVSRVPIQQVMAALAHQVTTDQQLRNAVTKYLRESGTQ